MLCEGVREIQYGAFQHCEKLESIILPDSLESIGQQAFMYCSKLTSIVIPENIKSFEYQTFYNANLKSLYYKGTSLVDLSTSNLPKSVTVYAYSENKPLLVGNYWHYVNGVPTIWIID